MKPASYYAVATHSTRHANNVVSVCSKFANVVTLSFRYLLPVTRCDERQCRIAAIETLFAYVVNVYEQMLNAFYVRANEPKLDAVYVRSVLSALSDHVADDYHDESIPNFIDTLRTEKNEAPVNDTPVVKLTLTFNNSPVVITIDNLVDARVLTCSQEVHACEILLDAIAALRSDSVGKKV